MTGRPVPPIEIRHQLPAERPADPRRELEQILFSQDLDPPDLIELVRARLDLPDTVPDVTIAATLAMIGGKHDARGRWLAAFGSPLGKHLAMRGSDLNTSLNVLLALAPRPAA